METVDDVLALFFGTTPADVRSLLTNSPDACNRLSGWLADHPQPMCLGDAMFRGVLAHLVDVEAPGLLVEYPARCRTADGFYLPLPDDDPRWGRVSPLPDVYSTAQGAFLEAMLGDPDPPISSGREAVSTMVQDWPISTLSSDTRIEYRKLSELLQQMHYCAALGVVASEEGPDPRLIGPASKAYAYAMSSDYATAFATPLFRLVVAQQLPAYTFAAVQWDAQTVAPSVERLCLDDGVLEYRLEDKVDESARHRSRSGRDQQQPWTYSTAYGLISLCLVGAGGTNRASILRTTLLNRLANWPECEQEVRIKEFANTLVGSATAYGAVAALSAVAMP